MAETPRHAPLLELRDIAEEVRAAGAEHRARLLSIESVELDVRLAERMELEAGRRVDHVTLVHYRDELPIQHEDRWVNPAVVPDFAAVPFATMTPSEHLLRSIEAHEVEHIVQAVLPTPEIGELLAVEPSQPCLRLERRTWNAGRVVTYAVLTYPGNRYDLGGRYSPQHAAQLMKKRNGP